MSVNAFSGVKLDRPLIEPGVYQQPQHIVHEEAPKAPVSKPLEQAPATDVVETKAPKKRKGFMEGISNITKFFVSLGEMTKASLKAIGGAAVTAAGTMLAFWTFGTLPKAFQQGKEALKEVVRHPIKNTSKAGKIVAGIAATGVAAYHVIKGILTMNQRTANVDHALKTGHRDA